LTSADPKISSVDPLQVRITSQLLRCFRVNLNNTHLGRRLKMLPTSHEGCQGKSSRLLRDFLAHRIVSRRYQPSNRANPFHAATGNYTHPERFVKMLRKPIIGITPSPMDDTQDHGNFHRYTIANTYTEAVEAAGGVPIVIPPQSGNIEEILDTIDGLLLSGGGDIDPAHYGDASTHEKTYGIHQGRDDLELVLARAALDRDMPTLCICRGIQVLNVALGGTLYQDVADEYSDELSHRQQDLPISKEEPGHDVTVQPDSLLAATYGTSSIAVNSFHHQSLKEIAPELRVNAVAPDGTIEAVEHPEKTWVLGVQWHPEMMFRAHDEHLKPFAALVEQASRKSAVPA
jgi:putative glutamine amidotransferase